MMKKAFALVVGLLSVVACGGSPTEPREEKRAVRLSVDAEQICSSDYEGVSSCRDNSGDGVDVSGGVDYEVTGSGCAYDAGCGGDPNRNNGQTALVCEDVPTGGTKADGTPETTRVCRIVG